MKKQTHNKGFTLIELLVVIAIIGILASIVLIDLNSARGKAQDVRIVSSVGQIKTSLESDFLNNSYADLTPIGNNIADLNPTGPNASGIILLITDIGRQNSNSNIATINISGVDTNVDLFTDGTQAQVGPTPPGTIASAVDTGVVIFTTNTAGMASDYAIYATTTSGYVCADSAGNTQSAGVGAITSVPMDANNKVICQ